MLWDNDLLNDDLGATVSLNCDNPMAAVVLASVTVNVREEQVCFVSVLFCFDYHIIRVGSGRILGGYFFRLHKLFFYEITCATIGVAKWL